ncbi:MAG: hypothetical protein FJX44_12180 [Alphaproteobacteria bacterium]|nr:hypothetical protein [Alphaproteobacteria bacterium]
MASSDRLTARRLSRSALLVGMLCVLPFLARAEEVLSRDEAKKRLSETEQQLQSSKAREQGLTQDLAAWAKEQAGLSVELIEAGKKVQASEARLTGTETKLAALTEQVNVIKGSVAERKTAIVKMLSAMQRMGRTPPPALVTRRDDALAVVRSAMLIAEIYPELKYQADNLSRELEGLVALETGIREQRDKEKRETDGLAAERARLDSLLAERKTNLVRGEAELARTKQALVDLAAEATDLNELVDNIETRIAKVETAQYEAEISAERALRERHERQALARPANENVIELKPESTKVAFASPGRMNPSTPFDAAKGTLRLPAQGKHLKRFGDKDATGGTAKGISLETRNDARITAPADGWVVYAGEFRSYGQLLIINMGGGYHVLLAGLSRIDVSLGQFVLAGEPIAEMGNSAAPSQGGEERSRPVLYVEFRQDGEPIDPDPWWGEASEKVQG